MDGMLGDQATLDLDSVRHEQLRRHRRQRYSPLHGEHDLAALSYSRMPAAPPPSSPRAWSALRQVPDPR